MISLRYLRRAAICFLAFLLAICAVTSADSSASPRSGSARGIDWLLDDSGTLIISGDGDMNKIQLNSDAFVWVKYKTEVQAVVLKEGVTNIGNYAFAHCTNLQEVTIPDTVTSIGRFAFADCPKLKRIFIPESVISIADDAFVQELVSSPDRKDLVIAGVSGSYAEQFAKGHRITFEDETGTLTRYVGKKESEGPARLDCLSFTL